LASPLNALRPLATGETRGAEMVGSRTRGARTREEPAAALDQGTGVRRAMGKVAEGDYEEMVARPLRAVRLFGSSTTRAAGTELIERELASRLVMPVAKSRFGRRGERVGSR
jgi:hypothetical protein